ncbi:protein NDR1-like [Quillaja saponaria]|uniref:Protein NDR1-like n=1 Tax=Quillaja saponaria TaxID=32244 RepID=A0AAD7PB90_QUISA|nr:protein NDR1-like [Quillaja saponaria]
MFESDGCGRCCLSFILTLGLTALFFWLSLRTDKPKCSIEHFYVPALNKSLNSPHNTSIYFMLQLNNPNKDKGIHYDNVNLTFSVSNNPNATSVSNNPNTTHQIGNTTIVGFRQGHGKKAKKWNFTETNGVNWTAFRHVLNNSTVVAFRVDFATAVKYKILFWYTKRDGLKLRANVEVDSSGEKVPRKKGIKLTSAAPLPGGCYSALVVFSVNLSLLLILGFM